MFKSIQTRLMFYFVPFSIILSIVLVSVLVYTEYSFFNKELNKLLFEKSLIIEKSIAEIHKTNGRAIEELNYDFLKGESEIHYSIIFDNKIITGNADPGFYLFDFEKATSLQFVYKDGFHYRAYIRRFQESDLRDCYIISEVKDSSLTSGKTDVITFTITMLVISYVLIWIISKRVSFSIQRPIKDFSVMAARMAEGQLNTEIDIQTNDELADIADSFNKLQNDLKSLMTEVLVKTGETAEISEIMEFVHSSENSLPTGIIGIDNSGLITIFNDTAQKITYINPDDILGKNIVNPMPIGIESLISSLKSCLSLGRIKLKTITEIYDPLGKKITVIYSTMIHFDQQKKVIGALVLFKRIEDIERFEKSAETNRSLRYIGEIAASLAHEMRNPLTSIKGYTQYLQMMLADRQDIQDELATITNETDRLNVMLSNFLRFAKPDIPDKKFSDLNSLLSYVLKFMRAEIPSNIHVIEDYAEVPKVMIDTSQFESVFINLFLNAIHAMPDGGMLNIKTHYSNERKMVIIEIADTGVGIPKDFADKIFMPFSTTKPDGTGLGLAICNRIVDAHNGIIEVESKEENGAKFTILLRA